jgi:hypothetical protein
MDLAIFGSTHADAGPEGAKCDSPRCRSNRAPGPERAKPERSF